MKNYSEIITRKNVGLLKPLMLLVLLAFSISACKDDDGGDPPLETMNLAEVAEEQNNLSLFLAAVEQAGLTSVLLDENRDLTVFAPNNQAFQSYLSQAGIELADIPQQQLQAVLQYHIVQGALLSNSLNSGTLTSLGGGNIEVAVNGGVTLNGTASVVTADLEASNGVIHIIDEVLVEEGEPEPTLADVLSEESDLSTLLAILSRPEFSDVVAAASNPESNLTVFAPTNTYFDLLLQQLGKSSVDELPEEVLTEIVTYHILGEALASSELENTTYTTLQGEEVTVNVDGGVTVNEIAVTEADLEATNGYLHKIEGVLLPAEARAVSGTVAGVAYFDARFTTLVAALREADLLNVLLEEGPYTVFAPTNEAFEAAGITDLAAFSQEELQAVLLYHVVSGNITSDQLENGPVTTASGEDFYVSLNEEGVYINGNAMVSQADVAADNGVVHVVDGVLMAPTQNIAEIVTAQASAENPEFSLLLQALQRADLAATLAGAGPYTVFAPTDAAFQEAGFDAAAIDAAPVETLQNILLYHVVAARAFSSDLQTGDITTAQGGTIAVDTESLTLTDGQGAAAALNAEMLNILATNGVIHVIDAVLMPAE